MLSHGKLVTALQYFTDKVEDYWHILYPLEKPENIEKDRYLYFYDISKKATDFRGKFTKDGIYLFFGYDGKYHIHALEIAQYALACWVAWRKTNQNIWLNRALLHCDWLLKNQHIDGSWKINHKNPIYEDLPSPWSSALAQGFAISALLRAYYHTNNKVYLNSAIKACDFLEKDINQGGVKRTFSLKNIEGFIYEEYPRKNLSGVLNGYISTILGIYELSLLESKYRDLFNLNINNLKKILPLYDIGFWSLYSLDGNIASGFYHRLVIKQLSVLCRFDNYFCEAKNKFEKYLENKIFALKAFMKKLGILR